MFSNKFLPRKARSLLKETLFSLSLFFFLFVTLRADSRRTDSESSEPTWRAHTTDTGTRYLDYVATVPILGHQIPIGLSFRCDLTETKDIHGTVGFDLYIRNTKPLKAFHFEDFEGPDAVTFDRKLMKVTVLRTQKPSVDFEFSPSGGVPSDGYFFFGISDVSTAKSKEKELLKNLASGADKARITITDSRDSAVKIELEVPLSGRESDFKALLKGLK